MTQTRDRIPRLFDCWEKVSERIRAAIQIWVFLDFDGTLVPYYDRPEDVKLSGDCRRILERLSRHRRVRVAIVNETFVNRYLKGVDPLTQRILVEQLIPGVTKLGPPVEWQIVGVFRNIHNGGIRREGFPEIDVPFAQSPWPQAAMAVRTTGDPAEMSKSIAGAVHAVDPDLALADVKTMDQIVSQSLVGDQFITALYVSFAAVALVLAAIGIYGVMAFAVAQRTHEIGLRMALGASQDNVLGLILKEGIILAAIGLGLGLVGACFVGRAMRGLLYGVGTIDVAAFSAVAVTLFMAALLACYVPANKAAKVDPMVALRNE